MKLKVMVGASDGLYEPKMTVTAVCVRNGVMWEGRGDDRREALHDLCLRMYGNIDNADDFDVVADYVPEPMDTDGDTSNWNENGESSERENDRYASRNYRD